VVQLPGDIWLLKTGYNRGSTQARNVANVLLFTQPGCLSCELMRIFLEANEIAFDERDISIDLDARRTMTEKYDSTETPTLIFVTGEKEDVIVGFDPVQLDRYLASAPSSDSVPES
jgi:glutaredoxin